jgi:hypothetical protein
MEQRESTSDRRLLLAGLGLAGAAALARVAKAGPLTPPPGPISPTGKSVAELSAKVAFTDQGISQPRRPLASCPSSPDAQFVITEPGAYYLTSNVAQVPGKVCVDIQCDCVDLDGDGFVFDGSGGGGGGGCIRAVGRRCIEIHECCFRQWQGCCCDMATSSACFVSDCVFDQCVCPGDATGPGACCRLGPASEICDCDSRDCDGATMSVGAGSHIVDCTCGGGGGGGFRCAAGSCIDNCACVSHSGIAFTCDDGCTLCDCECRASVGGAPAAVMGSSCVMERCLSHSSGGFVCLDDCECTDCDVMLCSGIGLACRDRCCVTGFFWTQVSGPAMRGGRSVSMASCDLTHCDDGIAVGDHSSISDCTAREVSGGGSTSGGVGILCGSQCSVTDCDCNTCVTGISCGSSCCVERGRVCSCPIGYYCASDCSLSECDALSCGTGAQCQDRCSLTDMEIRSSSAVSCALGTGCSADRCLCADGASHGFTCVLDCTFTDCEVSRCNGWAMTCSSEAMSVDECRIMQCWGLDCPAGCCVTGNELSYCDGGASQGLAGGAISCRGPRQTVSNNCCVSCHVGILIGQGCDGMCCESNEMTGCVAAGMLVFTQACLCSDNSCSARPPGAIGFDFGQCARGPLIDASGGGDVSLLPGSSHHCANWLF